MNFLEANNQEQTEVQSAVIKKRFQPLLYLVALIVVISLAFFWSSLKPSVQAFDFLPADTSFFWQWSDQKMLAANSYFLPGIDTEQAQKKLSYLQHIFSTKTDLLSEVIWFKKENLDQDYFLVKTKRALDKEEQDLLTQEAGKVNFSFLADQITLISEQEELKDNWPVVVNQNFSTVQTSEGLNLYFSHDLLDQFTTSLENFSLPWLSGENLFIHLADQRLKIYQTSQQVSEDIKFDWQNVLLPNQGQAIMAIADWSETNWQNWQDFIWPEMFSSLPVSSLKSLDLAWPATLLWENDQSQYLLVSKVDFRTLTPLFFSELPLQEQERTLVDGTLYKELVLDDLTWQDLAWPEVKAWQRGDLFILQQGDFYYLSNSEDILRALQPENTVFNSQKCLETGENLVDWLFLDQKVLVALKLDHILPEAAKFLDFNTYFDRDTQGWQFCW